MLNEAGKSVTMEMGCYGIRGLPVWWPPPSSRTTTSTASSGRTPSPRSVAIVPMNMHKSERVAEQAQQFCAELKAAGVDVLFTDDRRSARV